MFKYFALGIDFGLAIAYEIYVPSFSYVAILPLIFHTLTFIITPHCYANHCKPKKGQLKKQSTQQVSKQNKLKNSRSVFVSQQHNSQQQNIQIWHPPSFTPNKSNKQYSNSPNKSQISNKSQSITNLIQYQQCKQCGLTKWIRMQHCYYCNVCVHKYDHHCVLLGICIGQSNQKYYLPFLWTFLLNSFLQLYTYYGLVGNYLYLDQKGYQHLQTQYIFMSIGIIFFMFSIVIVGYLAVYHTYLAFCNDTTYQMRRRPQIQYFRGVIKDHPFDQGLIQNLRLIAIADKNNPIEWDKPVKPSLGVVNVDNQMVQSQKIKIQRKNRFKLPELQSYRMTPQKK